ncbi:MAG: MFS transporter, partial [Thermodesulfobacteriota bacterium]
MTKLFELVIMICGIIAFVYESKIGSYFVLFMLATQSAIFGPSKYGILPELVEEDKITKANGLMTSFTFLAIIIGTFFASFLLDVTNRNFLFAIIFCASLSVVGVITSLCIEYTPPSESHKRFNVLFLYETYKTLKVALTIPSLFACVLGSAFFLFLAAYVQLNMIPYAVQSLHLTDIQGGYLFLLTAVGIGIGSLLSGKISGRVVELGLVPLAGIGITLCCYMMDLLSPYLFIIIPLIFIEGLLGGIYEIPLESYIQVESPNKYRGQVVAATNFLSYFGVLCASLLLYLITEVFGFEADKCFTIMGTITLLVSILILFQFFDYLTRFVAMILSKLHFRTLLNGGKNIPDTPAVYLCAHTAWNDTLLMMGSQRRRIRFFIEQEQDHTKWLKQLYKMLRVIHIPSIEPLKHNQEFLSKIKETLKKGISVCIFLENLDILVEINKLNSSYNFQEVLKEMNIPIVPVAIEKGAKEKEPRFFKRLLERIHVPAEISFGSL